MTFFGRKHIIYRALNTATLHKKEKVLCNTKGSSLPVKFFSLTCHAVLCWLRNHFTAHIKTPKGPSHMCVVFVFNLYAVRLL